MNSVTLRIASRRSPLAMCQAQLIADQLQAHHRGLDIQIIPFVTQGDKILDKPLSQIGGKGLFVNELEKALLAHEADIAVHSSKDLPASLPADLCLGAVCERGNPFDAWVSTRFKTPDATDQPLVVGTASLRRQCQLAHRYPHLRFKNVRGNVQTRLAKLDNGEVDALILAAAGLQRLDLADRISHYLAPDVCLPAIGQGTLAVECRVADKNTRALLACIEHAPTRCVLTAERAFNHTLGGSCQVPIAGYATLESVQGGVMLQMSGRVGQPDGSVLLVEQIAGKAVDSQILGQTLAHRLIDRGAKDVMQSCLD